MTELKEKIDQLYIDYQPLRQLQNQLIAKNSKENFQTLVDEKTRDLEEETRARIFSELFGWGPIEKLKERKDIFDIIIQGPNKIFFETPQGLQNHHDCFLSERSFKNFVDRITAEAGILVDQKEPFGNGKVGPYRVHIIIPPAANEVTITLRQHNSKVFSFTDLLEQGFLSSTTMKLFEKNLHERKNFLIVGPTGSGKTTLLNSFLYHCKSDQRIVIIEDTDELKSIHPKASKLLSRELCPPSLNPYNMGDLVKQALRMRPDRLVIGEVRGGEAKDLLMALATGHSGSLGTLHADSAHQAILRLEMLIQMGAPQWSLHSIRQLIQMSLDYIVVLKENRLDKGVKEICKLGSLESFGLLLEPLPL